MGGLLGSSETGETEPPALGPAFLDPGASARFLVPVGPFGTWPQGIPPQARPRADACIHSCSCQLVQGSD